MFFWQNERFLQRYYQFMFKLFDFESDIKPLPIDFEKPWWQVLTKRKFTYALAIASEVAQSALISLTPLVIGLAINRRDAGVLFVYIGGYILLEFFNRFVIRLTNIANINASLGLKNSAYRFFLTVDPIYHSTKSSGQIISKITRAATGIQQLINIFTGTILPNVSGYISVVVAIAFLDSKLGILGVTSLIIITVVNFVWSYANANSFKKEVVKSGDKVSALATENLIQNTLIRSSFATNEQMQETLKVSRYDGIVNMSLAMANGLITTTVRMLYITSVAILAMIVLELVQTNQLDNVLAITIIVTYINGSSSILRIGSMIRMLTETLHYVEDLFDFVRSFGKQTFPVLQDDITEPKVEENGSNLTEKV